MSAPAQSNAAADEALARDPILLLDGATDARIQDLELSEEGMPGAAQAIRSATIRTICKGATKTF